MAFPDEIHAGDTVSWADTLTVNAASYVYYFRTNSAVGASVSGSFSAGTWNFVLPSGTSATFTAGQWFYQAVSTYAGAPTTQLSGGFIVKPSLVYAGAPTAVDLRSQAEIDLAAVEEAIRVLATGAQEYRIGTTTGGRMVKRADLAQLIAWRDRLKADIARAKLAENVTNGKGDGRSLYVRFT